jgi:hypothetical protein
MFAKLFEGADWGSGVKIGLGHLIRKIDGALVLPFVPVLKQYIAFISSLFASK